MNDEDAELSRIRQAIEALDRSLLALLRERQLLGEQAARAKIAAAVPLRDLLEGHPVLADAVEAVRSGRADVALLPLESTLEGSTRTMDLVAGAGLVISGERIQRDGEPYTRYVELARETPSVPEDVPCKTSVILTLADRAGALDEVLQAFSRQGVNLTRIESRPVPGTPPRSLFYVDMEGHAAGARVSRALEEARGHVEVRVVGSYPAHRS